MDKCFGTDVLCSVGECLILWVSNELNIKFSIKLKIFMGDTFQLLTEAYGEDSMSRPHVFKWHKWFLEGRETVKDDGCPGHLCTSDITNNNEKVWDVIWKDHMLGVCAIAQMVNFKWFTTMHWWFIPRNMTNKSVHCNTPKMNQVCSNW